MKAYGGVDVQIHVFLTPHKLEVSDQLHASVALLQEKIPPAHIE
jgi:hypothetical protein